MHCLAGVRNFFIIWPRFDKKNMTPISSCSCDYSVKEGNGWGDIEQPLNWNVGGSPSMACWFGAAFVVPNHNYYIILEKRKVHRFYFLACVCLAICRLQKKHMTWSYIRNHFSWGLLKNRSTAMRQFVQLILLYLGSHHHLHGWHMQK